MLLLVGMGMAKEGTKSYNMKKIYTIIAVIILILSSAITNAQSFSWGSHTTGSNSYSTSSLGVTMSSNANGGNTVSGFPNYQSANGGYLSVGVDWTNKTTTMKYTITFSKPLVGVLFLLYDVDQGGTWDDKVTIAGKTDGGLDIYPAITRSTYNVVSGTNNNILEGTTDNPSYLNNPAIVSFGGQAVKSFTLTYSAGTNSPSNPAAQYIGIGTITFGTVLPVELTSFKAEKRNTSAELKWDAENMVNFSHFEIERSATGNSDFTTIGTVSTGGLDKGSYSYTDLNVQGRMNQAYYRLKMVDMDGKFKYSPVMMISFDGAVIDVRPTILTAGQPVRITLPANNLKYDVRLFDLGGRMMIQKGQVNGNVQLETSQLNKGIYIVSVADGMAQKSFRITVQ